MSHLGDAMSGLIKQILTWPLTGGLDTKKAPFLIAPGSHITLDNVRMERMGEWKLRPGTTHNTADDLPGGNPALRAVELPGGGAVALCRQTDDTSAARIYSPSAVSPRWSQPTTQAASQSTPGYWTRQPVAGTNPAPTLTSMAVSATGLKLVAWWSGAGGPLIAELGTPEGEYQNVASVGGASRPRCTYVSSSDRLVMFFASGANLFASVWNGTSGAFVATTSIAADFSTVVDLSGILDAITYGSSATATAIYSSTTGTNLHQVEFNPSTAGVTNVNLAIVANETASLLPDPDNSGLRFIALSNNVPAQRVLRTNAAGAIQTNDLIDTKNTVLQMAGCAYQAGAGFMVVYMDGYPPVTGTGAVYAIKKRSGVLSAIVQLAPAGHPITLDTNAWREPGTDLMRFIMGLHVAGGSSPGDFQHTFYEMAMEFENGSASISNLFPEPQARLLPLAAGPGPSAATFGQRNGVLPQVQRLAADRYIVPLVRLSRIANAGGQQVSAYAVDTFTVNYANLSNATTLTVGRPVKGTQAAYLPAGNLLQSANGSSVVVHGASALPFQPSVTDAGAGALSAGAYSWLITVEMPDEIGAFWRSGPSVPASLTLAASHKATVVAKLIPMENGSRLRRVKLWRTQANGSAYQLAGQVIDTIANTTTVTFNDNVSDLQLQGSDFLPADFYAGSGNPTTITPRFSYVAFWDGRLWGVDADFPTHVYFSKALRPGIAPEFTAGQVLVVDDELGDLSNMVALDDKLLLLKGTSAGMGAYAVTGPGPDDLAGGNQYAVTRFSSDVGSIAGTPVVSCGDEAYMVALRGVYSINRSLEISFVGAAIDQFVNQPQVQTQEAFLSAMFDRETNEVRFQTTNYRLIYNRLWGFWYRDTGLSGALFTTTIGLVQYFFRSDATVWFEDPTQVTDGNGLPVVGAIRSPWLKPANIEGYLRLYRARLLGLRTPGGASADLVIQVFYDFVDTVVETDTPTTAPVPNSPFRADVRPRHQKCTAFSLQVLINPDIGGDGLSRIEAWSVLVGLKDGMQKLPQGNRWQ